MIERCNYCQKEHETGDPSVTIGGMPVKVCPEVPNEGGYMFNPRDFQMIPAGTKLSDLFPDGATFNLNGNLIA